jgi:peptidoglycan/xylan/chitin deacetylase (PgdA/CDA1 family)
MSRPSSNGERSLAILGYHKIGAPPAHGWDTWFYIPEPVFADQLAWLREHEWEVIDVERFLRGLEEPDSLPQRAALITFDDGYRSNLEIAVPWLRRYGYPAVMFVPTDFIGGSNSFDADAEPEEPICNWSELRELERLGVSVQSHGAAHRRFSELSLAQQAMELARSKCALEIGLQRAVEVFSFPYGDDGADPAALRTALQRTGYRAACLYGGGPNAVPVADALRLTRLAMGPDSDFDALLGVHAGAGSSSSERPHTSLKVAS